jgi:hypothetical protein
MKAKDNTIVTIEKVQMTDHVEYKLTYIADNDEKCVEWCRYISIAFHRMRQLYNEQI